MAKRLNAPRETKACAGCSTLIEKPKRAGAARWSKIKFCSQTCMGKHRSKIMAASRPTLHSVFAEKFCAVGDGCWEWQGTLDGYGYGVLDYGGHRYRAHVLALEFDGRKVLPGMVGCHDCDNPRCVRPSHLYPGTQADNVADAVRRGRQTRGEVQGLAKLTEEDVRAMRRMGGTYAAIARKFGVSRPTATKAILGKSWAHVK